MNGEAFRSAWQRYQREKRVGAFLLFVPALALFFVMGFRSRPSVIPPTVQLHPVHVSLLQEQEQRQGEGGAAAPAKRHFSHAMHVVERAPSASNIENSLQFGGETNADDSGANGQDINGEGGGSGAGNSRGIGAGTGENTVSDKSHLPEPFAKQWGCEWPWFTKIKDAIVHVRVSVNKLGRAYDVEVVSSNHHEFDAAAATCALQAHYLAGADKDGAPQKMQTRELPVHFMKFIAGEK